MAVDTLFLIAINEDGTFTSFTTLPEELPTANRVATTYDVYQTCKQIADNFDTQILVDRITKAVVSALNPPQETVQDKVKEALKKRNINPESVEPVN
jgi:beta-lactamase class A